MMCMRLTRLLGVFLVLGLLVAHANADLVGNWKFDEGVGNTVTDKSGNGNNGTLIGGPTWIAGTIGSGALSFDGSDDMVEVPHNSVFDLGESVTITAWINLNDVSTYYFIVAKGASGTAPDNYPGNFEFRTTPSGELQLGHQIAENTDHVFYTSDPAVTAGQWIHVAATLVEGAAVEFYVDGHPAGSAAQSGEFGILNAEPIRIASRKDGYSFFNGAIDDVQIYNHALSAEEIQMAMNGLAFEQAVVDSPEDGTVDVLRDVRLSWTPGVFAQTHTVYLGKAFEDVSAADSDNPMGTLVNQGLTDSTYEAGILDFGQTYYWRIDEVNGAPDNTVFKGEVWSFTVEPFSIPVENITATASGANATMEPENTINGSGLNELDQHSAQPTDMWLTLTDGSWIQYEFDRAYKLDTLLIWNSNQPIETFIGFGVKDAIVETSLDGITWIAVEGVAPFAQATGQATYEANTTVDLGGTVAQYVRISPQSAHGTTGQSGLSEVRFLAIPTYARELAPVDGSATEGAEVTLTWRAGREAGSHQINVGTAADNLTLAGTTDETVFITEALDYAQTYFWQVVEVNEAQAPATYASEILSFTTPAYGTVDDFESYSGEEDAEVFMTWIDGYGGDASLGGSTTGHIDGPFVETGIVYGGQQSLPIYYDNDGGFMDIDGKTSSPTFSEVVREFDSPQDWTASGIKSLSLFFRGASDNVGGQLYVKINNTKIAYDADPVTLSRAIWHPWTIDLSTVGGNLSQVSSLTIGIEGAGATGIAYIDEIRLYPVLTPHAALTNHIPVFSATATSSLGGGFNRMDAFAIDGSGLNADGSHTSTPDGFMWLNNGSFTTPNDLEPETVFDLGAEYIVDTMLVWNYNESTPLRGVGTADILTAGADGVFSVLIENQAFDAAPGTGDVDFHQTIDLAGVKAQFIKLDISANLGGDNDFVGLSEVQFQGTPSP
jgi:hypothetical protein